MPDTVKFKFSLGSKVRDRITGFTGLIDSRLQFLNGCLRYSVMPPCKEDGKMPDGHWIDEQQLELVDEGIKVEKSKTGGPVEKVKANQKF